MNCSTKVHCKALHNPVQFIQTPNHLKHVKDKHLCCRCPQMCFEHKCKTGKKHQHPVCEDCSVKSKIVNTMISTLNVSI